jgi:hypothetical protein
VVKDETMMSLWDYRGHADYDKQGQKVYDEAKRQGAKVEQREVETKTYKGVIMLYPKWFLDEYFNPAPPPPKPKDPIDDLPF